MLMSSLLLSQEVGQSNMHDKDFVDIMIDLKHFPQGSKERRNSSVDC